MVEKQDKKYSMKYTFPRGHLPKLILTSIKHLEEKNEDLQEDEKHIEGLIQVYIKERFYDNCEVKLIFWTLLYRGLYKQAI